MNFRMVLFGVQQSSRDTSHHSEWVIALGLRVRHWGVKLVLRLPSIRMSSSKAFLTCRIQCTRLHTSGFGITIVYGCASELFNASNLPLILRITEPSASSIRDSRSAIKFASDLGAGAVPPGTYCQTPQCHLVKRPRLRGLPD